MTMRFRNLDFDANAPLDRWPAEAIETVIDRGSLSDWHHLAQAIRHNPWGPAARTAETVVAWGEHYGVDALISNVIRQARKDVASAGAGRLRRTDLPLARADGNDAPPVRTAAAPSIAPVRLRAREGGSRPRRSVASATWRCDSPHGQARSEARQCRRHSFGTGHHFLGAPRRNA